eukprot:m.237764 g.237764  ORF g.237764 m.237764 type:complete len:196 (-) comp19379_c0_seq4:1198-1785(-)
MMFGQVVVGPPGSGKSTYCTAIKEFLTAQGRDVCIVNLDPANDNAECDLDIRELIELDDVTERLGLGPNGGLVYCIEFLCKNSNCTVLLSSRCGITAPPSCVHMLLDAQDRTYVWVHAFVARNMPIIEYSVLRCVVTCDVFFNQNYLCSLVHSIWADAGSLLIFHAYAFTREPSARIYVLLEDTGSKLAEPLDVL